MVRQTDFAEQKCPRGCPFLDRLCGGTSYRFCSYTLYARSLDPDRLTRTTVSPDGKVDYHIPPHCDIYEKYKDTDVSRIFVLSKVDFERFLLEMLPIWIKRGENDKTIL